MSVEIGQKAPDFELRSTTGDTVKLSSFHGQKAVALVFYPFTYSKICQAELCAIRDDFSRYESTGVQVLAVSCDAPAAQKQWAEDQGYAFPILSDFWPHGAVAQAYGVFDETRGAAMRATFLIGKDGNVLDAFRTDDILTAREASRYEESLAKL